MRGRDAAFDRDALRWAQGEADSDEGSTMSDHASPGDYDVIVVGSGANGGIAAMSLAERGLKVLVLEAGPQRDPFAAQGHDIKEMTRRLWRLYVTRRQTTQAMHGGYWDSNPDLLVDDIDHPYTTPEGKPFYWLRGHQVGGRSMTWGGVTLRLSDFEFKAASHDGFGMDWPIGHADLAPHYARIERFLRVHGNCDGLPQLPDGDFLPGSAFTPGELQLKAVIEEQWPDRPMIISRGIRARRHHKPTAEEPWSGLSSNATSLASALATGNATLRSDAMVSHVIFDPETRKARGVGFVDRVSREHHEARASVVLLCASTLGSVRILLNSTSERQPGGFDDDSDCLGRYLMDHVSSMSQVFFPGMAEPDEPFEMLGSDSFFLPRTQNLGRRDQEFLRGYGLWGGIQRASFLPNFLRKVGPGCIGTFTGHGEALPRAENRATLDPELVDAWGLPALHIDCELSDNERLMAADMRLQIEAMAAMIGGECVSLTDIFMVPIVGGTIRKMENAMRATAPGLYIHEVGGARMGDAPGNSVVNPHNQVWGVDNLLVTDGACWTSSGWQNPTLTQMAITARACEYIADELSPA